ncbi:MAG: zinc ribbon domain-containing protein [Gemmatimonadetes bacterium]|nr:zinc ribbon domain-containing protein [Gemmatimonadota bacterium]
MKCPGCGKESQGRFCSHCGTPLQAGQCSACGARLTPGTRFCTQCGARVAGATAPARVTSGNLGWYIAASVLAVLILALGIDMAFGRKQTPAPAGVSLSETPGAAVTDAAPGPLSGTPREQADRLFNRIMTAREAGDTAQISMFLPMALQAYRAIELDHDGLYHLAMLETLSGDAGAGLATARRILDTYPDHLLALASAAEASARQGDSAAARQYWQHYLDAYGKEKGKTLQEYVDHERILPEYEATARQAVGR